MTWQTIAASETDANSPLNQTLFDKLRGNLDYLKSVGAAMKFVSVRVDQNADAYDAVLDESIDWRDRFVQVQGVVFQGTTSDLNTLELGGSNDGKISNQYTAAILNTRAARFNDWFYTAAGGASRTTNPRLWQEDLAGDPDCYLWVNSTNGKLMLGVVTARSSGFKNILAHLRLVYSEDQGGH